MLRLFFNRRVLLIAAGVGVLLAIALWPKTIAVDVGTVTRGPLVVTIDDEGVTRVRNRFVVSAPVSGRVLRIELEPGDQVKKGTVVARLQAETPPLLDARSRAEAEAAIATAHAVLGRARADEERARAAFAQAERELTRARELLKNELASRQVVDTREAEERTAREALNAATFAARAAASDLQRAEARLAPAAPDVPGRVVTVTAPVDGVVLKRVRESESVVPAGDPLLEIGDPRRLEIVSDLLSTDAVRVKPGARTMIEQWGGDRALDAKVRRIEPSGFTKISALGVEEQRVNVVLDFTDPAEAWTALGDAYRVEVRIVTWETADALKVPTSALFRKGEAWAVYLFGADGRARQALIELGHQTGQEAEVTNGLSEGARVILHPGDTLTEGTRVSERPPS
jgi:HlyD family secretion protein